MRKRFLLLVAATLGLTLAFAAPVSAKDFGTIYVDGVAYRTFGNRVQVPTPPPAAPLSPPPCGSSSPWASCG